MTIESILWRDAHDFEDNEWVDLTELPGDLEHVGETVGFVLKEDDYYVLVAHTVMAGAHACGLLAIPKGCIIQRRLIA